YYDLANKAKPAVSGLISNRWETGIGDIGILVAGVFQRTAYRNDALDGGGNVPTRGVLDLNNNGSKTDQADTVIIQTGRGQGPSFGGRERLGFNGALQWQASPELLFHVDGAYNRFKSQEYTYALYTNPVNAIVDASGLVVPGALGNDIQVFEGTGNFKSGTINNNEVYPFTWGSRNKSTVWQVAGGAQYDAGPVHLYADLSYTKTTGSGTFRQVALKTIAPTVFLDFGQSYPSFRVGGVDLTDPNAVRLAYAAEYPGQDDGSELAWKTDAKFDIDSGFLTAMKFGIRYADRQTAPISYSGYYRTAEVPVSQVPSLGAKIVDLKADYSPPVLSRGFTTGFTTTRFLGLTPDLLFNEWDKVRSYYGTPPLAATSYDLSEKTFAGYAMAEFSSELAGIRISGNGGVRVIRTETSSLGTLVLPDGSTTPLSVSSAYFSALPMLNVKADLTDKLVLRGALSKGLTRPDFGALSPVLNLSYVYRTGSSGNPALGPIKAKQADLSAEYYFTNDSFAYVAGFLKNVDGFITNVGVEQNIPGQSQPFIITQPVNGTAGKIRGFEVGWNQFLTFLPGVLSGLGFQANYTYVYSEAPSPLAGSTESYPLLGLSKNSYNLVGIYEKGPLSMRVAYNWRDKFFNSLISGSMIDPDYFAAAGYLDASINIDVTKNFTIFADANNLTRAKSITYYNDPQRPHAYSIDDRRFSAGARFRF
ncbi:MAG: TonB-dependent receptor, partial [Oxalobacteraceae bacterium]